MQLIKPFRKLLHSGQTINAPEIDAIRQRARTDHEFFVREFFSHHVWGEFSEMHQDFCEMETIPDRRGKNEVIAAPRGNAKTTFKMLIKAIHAIVYKYHPFIIIVGYSASEAIDKVKDIRDELISNEKLIQTYGALVDPNSAKSDFITRNGVRVVARSKGGQIRGLKFRQDRPSLIILDDIESQESVNTPEQRKKTEDWFFKDVMGAGRADGETDYIMVGTVLHQEALLSKLLASPGWDGRKYQAIQSWASNQPLWDKWAAIYSELEHRDSPERAKVFFEENKAAMLDGVAVLWPDGESYYKLMEYKLKYGLASLYSEKQNDPYDPERQILNPDACDRFKVAWEDDGTFYIHRPWMEADKQKVHSSQLKIIAFHDPALAETNKSDYAAIAVCAQDGAGYVYALDCYLRKDPPSKQIERAFDLWEKWRFSTLYLETVGFQELLKPQYYAEATKRGIIRPDIVGVDQHTNKIHRIGTMEPWFSNGWIKLNEKLDPLLIDQLRLFPTTHDDGPDALHGCVSRLKKPFGQVTESETGGFIR